MNEADLAARLADYGSKYEALRVSVSESTGFFDEFKRHRCDPLCCTGFFPCCTPRSTASCVGIASDLAMVAELSMCVGVVCQLVAAW